nr:hypothetical protein [uncultured Halomonas sp.]
MRRCPEDYEKLLAILDDAVKQQREHTQAMLGEDDASTGSA